MEVRLFLSLEIQRILEKILAVGSLNPENVKAEWLDVSRNVWESLPDYPYGMSLSSRKKSDKKN